MNRVTELNGYDLKFVMHKILFSSDVKPNNNRLSIPKKKTKCDFLTEDEIVKLEEKKNNDKMIGLEVTVLDPCLREYTLPMKKWTMKSDTYNLVKEWNKIVATNKFKEDQELQIWSFRVNTKLELMAPRPPPQPQPTERDASDNTRLLESVIEALQQQNAALVQQNAVALQSLEAARANSETTQR
ncbi:B3 domain-containing protein At5g24050-like [Vigna angularis]|uniref:B3 domain-containing protein At5g24050-like n=1 Tax=Phaseolus angularis TaxID=3914 RepID=UPI000809E486|nr:B3 domain-containing protein At5g24050-like [Vigna angularis]